MQPRQRRRRQARCVSRGRRQSLELRRAVDGAATCSPRSGARTIRATSRRAIALAHDAGFERVNVDLIYGTPGESHRRLARQSRRRDRARRVARQRVRARRWSRPRPSACASPRARPPPTTISKPTRTFSRSRVLAAAGLEWYEVSNWAPSGRGVPPQPLVLERGRVPRHRVRRARSHCGSPLVERAHARALHRRDRGRDIGRRGLRAARSRPAGGGGVRRSRYGRAAVRRWPRGPTASSRSWRRRVSCTGSTIASCSPLTAGSSLPM